jgi:hypothetical protein
MGVCGGLVLHKCDNLTRKQGCMRMLQRCQAESISHGTPRRCPLCAGVSCSSYWVPAVLLFCCGRTPRALHLSNTTSTCLLYSNLLIRKLRSARRLLTLRSLSAGGRRDTPCLPAAPGAARVTEACYGNLRRAARKPYSS